jgi:hypothetical protein
MSTHDTTGPDFDALCAASRNIQNKLGEIELWKQAVNLPEWYFVASGEGDEAEPVIGTLGKVPHVLVFTDEERAQGFARLRAMRASDARDSSRDPASFAVGTLVMDVADALAFFKDLAASGVQGALFNSGEFQFHCGLIELADRHHRYAR